ncbi:MAG TPA: helix-turn-helix domain-containing GNAT family N-acetyltransferase [Gemmatimonadales bacterium]
MDAVARVRSFNRTVTARIGALDAEFLGRGRSLGACRLLFEIGTGGGEVRALRARLGLDSGYLSRLLRGLEEEGLVRTGAAPGDARVRYAALTAAGRRELAALDRLSDDAAAAMLESLSERQRDELTDAMALVERLLRASAVRMELEDVRSRDARECLARYFEELAARFEAGFDPALGLPLTDEQLTPPRGLFVIARLDGEAVGCGALKLTGGGYAEIKRMWVAESARGLGIARRILARLEELALERRARVVRLDTNRALPEAHALYRSSGYREVPPFNDDPYAHLWFEKTLRGPVSPE